MDKALPALYRSYGMYTNRSKMMPHIIDGLLPVHRRLLLGCHQGCRTGWKKTPAILGDVVARWHPHQLDEGPMETLVQNGFADGDGQWGETIGIEPSHCAAMRYTKVRANARTEKMAFKYVKDVPWVVSEDEMEPEPIALPTMIPFCLMTKYEIVSIGFGYKSEIPCYSHKDLIERLLALRAGTQPKNIKPTVNGCTVTGGEYKKLLTTGTGKIEVQGKHTIRKGTKTIVIHGWSPRIKFPSLLDRIDRYKKWNLLSKKDNDIGWIDQTGDGDNFSKIEFKVAKQRNVQDIFDKMVEAVTESIRDTLSYNIYVVDMNGNVVLTSVDDMLLEAYKWFNQAAGTNRRTRIKYIDDQLNEFYIVENIRDHVSGAMIKHKDNPSKACKELEKITKIPAQQIEPVVRKHTIYKMMAIRVDKKKLNSDKAILNNEVKNMDKICETEYQEML